MSKTQDIFKHRTTRAAIIVAVALLALGLLALAGCQSATAKASPPPHLLGRVQMHAGDALTSKGVLALNGLFYVMNEVGSVAVLDGPRQVALITFTVPSTYRTKLYAWMRHPDLTAIEVQPQTGYIYVTDAFLDVVHVISGTTVLTDIAGVGVRPSFLGVQPKTGYIYVASDADAYTQRGFLHPGYLSVISNTQVITHLLIGELPQAMLINPANEHLYISHNPIEANRRTMTIISGTQVLTNPLFAGGGGSFQVMAADKQTGEMYMFEGSILVYWNGKDIIKRLSIGALGYTLISGLAVDTQRGWAYVCAAQGRVFVVKQDQIIANLPVQHYPIMAVKDETHDFMYVANYRQHSMSVIRGTEVITTLDTEGAGPGSITVDEKRGYIYVSNADMGGSVSVFGFDPPTAAPPFWQSFLPWLRH